MDTNIKHQLDNPSLYNHDQVQINYPGAHPWSSLVGDEQLDRPNSKPFNYAVHVLHKHFGFNINTTAFCLGRYSLHLLQLNSSMARSIKHLEQLVEWLLPTRVQIQSLASFLKPILLYKLLFSPHRGVYSEVEDRTRFDSLQSRFCMLAIRLICGQSYRLRLQSY